MLSDCSEGHKAECTTLFNTFMGRVEHFTFTRIGTNPGRGGVHGWPGRGRSRTSICKTAGFFSDSITKRIRLKVYGPEVDV